MTDAKENISGSIETNGAFAELERAVYAALETYSNVHRGSGHYSMVSTHLYEQAREIVLDYLGLDKGSYLVIFCTPRGATILTKQLEPGNFQMVSCTDIGLSLGVRALAVKRSAFPEGAPFQTGGGTTKLISRDWVIWADGPDRFEAGTPAVINIIAFAKALSMVKQSGKDIFTGVTAEKPTAGEILHHDDLESYSDPELLDKLRQTLIGRSVLVPTAEGERPFINLDNSASTPTFSPVWDAFRQAFRQTGQVKKEIIREVKSVCTKALNVRLDDFDVIFTSNTTESINLVAESMGLEPNDENEPVVLNTLSEHSSNDLPWRMVSHCTLIRLSVDAEGFVNLNELETQLNSYNKQNKSGKKRIRLVAVTGASNVLGVCNNLKEIGRIVHQYGARLLVDAAQLVAHSRVDMEACGIDYLAFSAHKVYAPFGCGVLVVRKGLLNFSASELELIRSSGEENIGGIAALGKALLILQRIGMEEIRKEEQALTERAMRGMKKIPGLKIYGLTDPESPGFHHKIGVIVFEMKNKMPARVAGKMALEGGIGVRYGCHCAHIIIKHLLHISPFMERLQRVIQTLFPKLKLQGLVRVSIGIGNSEGDIDKMLEVLGKIAGSGKASAERGSGVETLVLPKAEAKKLLKDFVKASAMRVYS